MADGVGPAEEEGVVEAPVDGLGVVALAEQPVEVGVGRGDRADVLGPVELAAGVLVVAVEPDGDGPAGGEAVVVVPAVPAVLALGPVGADPAERTCTLPWAWSVPIFKSN